MKRALLATAFLAAFGTAAPVGATGPATQGDGTSVAPAGGLKAGAPVPKFRARDVYGADVRLEDLLRDGKRPLLAFWSIYCEACVEKLNAMTTIQAKYGPQGLQIVSINTDGEYQKGEAAIRDFLADYEKKHGIHINFPVLYDERNGVPAAMNIEFLPTIVSVDPAGRVLGFYQGFNEAGEAEILAGIEALVTQMFAAYPAGAAKAAETGPPAKQ